MRQKEDQPFTHLLNRFITASQTEADIQCIQCVNPIEPNYPKDALHIFAENAPVDQHNNEHLQCLRTPLHRLKATDQYPPNVNKQGIDRVLARGRSETGGLDSEILVKENCRVMLTTNIDINDRLINGQMGTIKKIAIYQSTSKPSVIYVKFDDSQAGIKTIQKCTDNYAREHSVVPNQCVLARIKLRPGKSSSAEIQRLQFPITLAWACTVHKVQGLTVNEIVVCFDLHRQKHFNYGQIYVALSGPRSLQGLHVIGQLENKHVRANSKVHAEYHRLRQQADTDCSFSPVNDDKNFKISLCLLNIRSLQKHGIDIKHDANLNICDILALTETQLLPHHSDNIITEILHPYAFHRQDHPTDKYSNSAICSKNNINLVQKQYFPSINGLICNTLIANINKELKFLLTHRKNNSDTQQYLQNLNNILQTTTVDIILGDFNINYFNELLILLLKQLTNSLQYIQIVNKPTFISAGSLLDQVYVKQSLYDEIQNEVVTVYYSDHDCVKTIITQ